MTASLHCEPLEPRAAAVSLDWRFAPDPWLTAREAAIREAGDAVAALATRPDVPRIAVRVEPLRTNPDGRLAEGQPWQWEGEGVIRFDTGRNWDAAHHFASVVKHEVLHVLGVTGHTDDPRDLLYAAAPPPTRPQRLTTEGANALRSVGWAVEPEPPRYTLMVNSHGWVWLATDHVAAWRANGWVAEGRTSDSLPPRTHF